MKRIIATLAAGAVLLSSSVALASPNHSNGNKPATSSTPVYCGNSPYDVYYKAIYNYPTGSYWVSQINAYPAYYAAHNAYYQAHFGC